MAHNGTGTSFWCVVWLVFCWLLTVPEVACWYIDILSRTDAGEGMLPVNTTLLRLLRLMRLLRLLRLLGWFHRVLFDRAKMKIPPVVLRLLVCNTKNFTQPSLIFSLCWIKLPRFTTLKRMIFQHSHAAFPKKRFCFRIMAWMWDLRLVRLIKTFEPCPAPFTKKILPALYWTGLEDIDWSGCVFSAFFFGGGIGHQPKAPGSSVFYEDFGFHDFWKMG